MTHPPVKPDFLFHLILDELPQTQCQRCTYDDCTAYAQAIVSGDADINQCPPGGNEGALTLAKLTGGTAKPVEIETYGAPTERHVAYIDETWCIGCTLCIAACPVDAIIGCNKAMHTVIEDFCTGCELCVPTCPVDCIVFEPVTPEKTGWQAWSKELAQQAKNRYERHQSRLSINTQKNHLKHIEKLENAANNIASKSRITNPQEFNQKKIMIAEILEKAKQAKASKK